MVSLDYARIKLIFNIISQLFGDTVALNCNVIRVVNVKTKLLSSLSLLNVCIIELKEKEKSHHIHVNPLG